MRPSSPQQPPQNVPAVRSNKCTAINSRLPHTTILVGILFALRTLVGETSVFFLYWLLSSMHELHSQ